MTDRSAIGIDIGGTRIRAARISPAGEILATVATRTQSQSPELVPGQIVELVRSLDAPGVAGIGIGVPGRVDANTGEVLSGGFVDLSGLDLLGEMATIPIVVDNDANMAMRAEAAVGAAAGARTAVLFTIGTGIGGSIIVDGAMLKGHRHGGPARPHRHRRKRPRLRLRATRLRRDHEFGHGAGAPHRRDRSAARHDGGDAARRGGTRRWPGQPCSGSLGQADAACHRHDGGDRRSGAGRPRRWAWACDASGAGGVPGNGAVVSMHGGGRSAGRPRRRHWRGAGALERSPLR